jgi:hypothetical protein
MYLNSNQSIALNEEKILHIAKWINRRNIPADKEDLPVKNFDTNMSSNYWFALVAICHQTSPIDSVPLQGMIGDKLYRGWDYLKEMFELISMRNNDILTPQYWRQITGKQLLKWFGTNLTDPDGRARLLNDMGHRMIALKFNYLLDIAEACKLIVLNGEPCILNTLSEFDAYRDPVRKKSYFLLSLLENNGLITFVDRENIGPPVDYHEVRGHLRIGTVVIKDDILLDKILHGKEVSQEEDVMIRSAVHDAILSIRNLVETITPSVLHYLFWNVFRSHCSRLAPKCAFEKTGLPDRYLHLSNEIAQVHCPFVLECNSFEKKDFSLVEHSCKTDYY